MLMAEELDSKNLDNAGIDGQISFGEDAFYQKYEQKIKLLTDKFMPPKDEDEHLRAQKRKEMEQYADYRNYLSFSMFEQVTDETERSSGKILLMIWREGILVEKGRTRNMWRFWQDLLCCICSRANGIPKSSWCCWMRPFLKWIRSEARSA